MAGGWLPKGYPYCPDNPSYNFQDRKQREVLSMARLIGSENPIVCVQVGDNPDKRFLGGIAFSSRYGKLLDIYEAPQFARYPTNVVVASKIIGSVSTTKYSVDDVREALKSKEEFASITEKDISNSTDNDLQWEGDPGLQPIGTRVRRGPCWPFSNQDSCMPGTVIGYRNGCPDWKWFDQDGGNDNIGTVYKVKRDNTIFVQWFNGTKGNYRFGYDNKYDVKVWCLCIKLYSKIGTEEWDKLLDEGLKVNENTSTNLNTMEAYGEKEDSTSQSSQTEDELLDEGQIDQENTSTNQNTGEDYGEQENSNTKGSQEEDECDESENESDEGQKIQKNTLQNQNSGKDYEEQSDPNSKGEE
uniref:E3 ubiquitin-protein ligase MIB2 n=1 Tax=Magallana gigas TaxID=29159 RepID=K1R6M0_MAGGI